MKVTIEIDCTPDEARQFFGLPDVKPMQAALMAKLEAQLTDAADRFSPDAVLRSWMTLVPATPDAMADMVKGFFQAAGGGRPKDGAKDGG